MFLNETFKGVLWNHCNYNKKAFGNTSSGYIKKWHFISKPNMQNVFKACKEKLKNEIIFLSIDTNDNKSYRQLFPVAVIIRLYKHVINIYPDIANPTHITLYTKNVFLLSFFVDVVHNNWHYQSSLCLQ